jgi:FkbM family methyltransferase
MAKAIHRVQDFLADFARLEVSRIGQYSRGHSLRRELAMVLEGRLPRVIVDVGANVGVTALAYADWFPQAKVYALEPIPSTFEKLQANTADHGQIECFMLGCGDEAGQFTAYLCPDSKESSLVPIEKATGQARVEVVTLDAFCHDQGLETVDFLKVDCEGYDLNVLRGADRLLREKRVRSILVECALCEIGTHHVALREFTDILGPAGYTVAAVYGQQGFPSTFPAMTYCNVLFVPLRGDSGVS